MNGRPHICLLVVLGLSLLAGCKKLELEDEIDPLVGTWRWVYSGTSCENPGPSFLCTETVPSCNDFTLEIKKKGVLITRENGKKKDRYCIEDAGKGLEAEDFTEYVLFLEDFDYGFAFYLDGDSLITAHFPFPLRNEAGELQQIHASVFVQK